MFFPVIQPIHHAGSAYEKSRARAEALGVLPIPEVTNEDVRFARPCRAAAQIVFPKDSEILEGFLGGGHWNLGVFLAYFFARKQGILRGCTNFAVLPDATKDGHTVVGRN